MIDRRKIKKCPICDSNNISHIIGDHFSQLRGTTRNVPQTVCHDCGEIFFGPDSLEALRSRKRYSKTRVTQSIKECIPKSEIENDIQKWKLVKFTFLNTGNIFL